MKSFHLSERVSSVDVHRIGLLDRQILLIAIA